jgi:SAM-dependent methyltransferase
MTRIYDVFVDWAGRLAREMPGLEKALREVGARRILDVGCGTGRHLAALAERGFEAHGADPSPEMLERAGELLGGAARLHCFAFGDEPGPELLRAAPFDAVVALGNVWPFVSTRAAAEQSCRTVRRLLRPDGLLLLGFKALAVRRESGTPWLPLLKREHEGRPLWFLRFVDFDVPSPESGITLCDLHMAVVAGDAVTPEERREALLHRATRMRAWSPGEAGTFFREQGFAPVRVGGRIDDLDRPPSGEDVFVAARPVAVAPA